MQSDCTTSSTWRETEFPFTDRLSIADAQALAIRKLLAKSCHDSTLSPGPPLPKGHPSPGLLAKLSLNLLDTYSSALALVGTSGSKTLSSGSSRRTLGPYLAANKPNNSPGPDGDVAAGLRRYLLDEVPIASALSHKWLGIEAGEAGRTGEAITYLSWAEEELERVKEGKLKSKFLPSGKRFKEMASDRKDRVEEELDNIRLFLDVYTRENDAVSSSQPTSFARPEYHQPNFPSTRCRSISILFHQGRPYKQLCLLGALLWHQSLTPLQNLRLHLVLWCRRWTTLVLKICPHLQNPQLSTLAPARIFNNRYLCKPTIRCRVCICIIA